MNIHLFSDYQKGQVQVITSIEQQNATDSINFSIVPPVDDYDTDRRMALTGVHFPKQDLIEYITHSLQTPLKIISPEHYYYSSGSLHMTIKNVRTTHYPQRFSEDDTANAKHVFSQVLTHHSAFRVYFFRLLQFKLNLALVGTTDPELDSITLDLDRKLANAGVRDDKVYTNKDHFFGMMTLLRFKDTPTGK